MGFAVVKKIGAENFRLGHELSGTEEIPPSPIVNGNHCLLPGDKGVLFQGSL